MNNYLKALDGLRDEGVPADTVERVKRLFGWRPLEIIQIRPRESLRGNAFDAFGDAELRLEYIDAGRRAAHDALPP